MRYGYLSLALLLTLASCSPKEMDYGMDLSDDWCKQHQIDPSGVPTDLLNGLDIQLWFTEPFTFGMTPRDQATPSPLAPPRQGLLMQEGLDFVQKGFQAGGQKSRTNYLEVPLTPIYQYPLGPGALQGGLGPYFAYGIGGKTGTENSFGDPNTAGGLKRFDFGLSLRAGYTLNMGLRAYFGYDYGLIGIAYPGQ